MQGDIVMKNIKFETRKDYQEALEEMCLPLRSYYSPGKAFLMIGHTAAHYGERTAGLEGFSRVLWGLVPLWYGGGSSCLDQWILEGIRHGTDPRDPEYWGDYTDGEQAYVEMAALAFAVWMTPEKVWEPLSLQEKEYFRNWLFQINTHRISDNNWLFFRVLVNCALRHVGTVYSEEQLAKDLSRVDDFYLGDGWYSDGVTRQRDYYIGFALHFYSLIYARLMEKEDPERSARYKERAALFAQDFIYWFGSRGEALPFGRSLTYRFAQVSFWCGLAFAGVEAFSWGVIRGIVNRHFRYWFSQPILDCENKLTLGYVYPDLTICEGYNAPNSPYWSWKSFLVLALPKEHPFWSSQEQELPALEPVRYLSHPWMIMQRGEDGYVTALTSGQYAEWEPVHVAEKFEKFAYSSYFGFQCPRACYNLKQAAPDNMLAFCRDGYYFVRRRCSEVSVEEGKGIYSRWSPMEGIEVETRLKPCGKGHLRSHVIHAQFPCTAVEGGFALPYHEPKEVIFTCGEGFSQADSTMGRSRMKLHKGIGKGEVSFCEANVNLLYPRTVLPCIWYEIPKGDTEISVYVEGTPEK